MDLNKRYPSNSHWRKDSKKLGEKPPATKIIKGEILPRKKPLLATLLEDNARSIVTYLLLDVLIPAAKDTIYDLITNGSEMLLYGQSKRLRRDKNKSFVSYTGFYNKRDDVRQRNRVRSRFDDIVMPDHLDAEEVLSNLVDLIDDYGAATVADFYGFVGAQSEWSDNKFGWDNLSKASIVRVREGYIIDLPKPEALD